MGAQSFGFDRVRPILVRSSFLGQLPDIALLTLLRRGQLKTYRKGDVIYRRGDPGDSLLVMVSGGIKLTTVGAGGKEIVLHFHRAGDIYGEIAALDGGERAATAIALEESDVFIIPSRDLVPTLKAHPDAMFAIMQGLCGRLRAGAVLFEDSTLEMRGRVARGLLRLMAQLGIANEDGVTLQLSLSQEDLGSYLRIARANVSRQLGLLRVEGVIRINGTQIIITDARGLEEIAEAASVKE